MSRSASTLDRTEEIVGLLDNSNLKSLAYLEVEKNSQWVLVEDLDESKGINWSEDRRRFAYSNFSLTPTASVINFEVVNKNGIYSEGSGSDVEEIFGNDSRVRLTAGYRLSTPTDLVESISLANAYEFYLTQFSTNLIPNISGTSALGRFADLFNTYYDTILYDASTYTPLGYAVYLKDNINKSNQIAKTISMTCTFTGGAVYFKEVDFLSNIPSITNSTAWTLAGATVSGSNTYSITCTGKRYLLIAIIFDGADWSSLTNVSSLTVTYNNYVEWIYKSVFYLDSPTYTDPPSPSMPKISCAGRDIYKKALETSINVKDLSGKTIDAIIKEVCDSCGISYSATSISNLSSFTNRTLTSGLGTVVKADEVFSKLMDLVNKYSATKYEMYLAYDTTADDNILFVNPRPSSYEASVVFDYRKYKSLGSLKKNYDKLLSRLTISTSECSVNQEVLLATQTVSASGDTTISWVGNAVFKRYELVGSDVATLVDVTNTSLTFNFATTPSTVINIYGCKFKTTEPTYWSEYINHSNMIVKGGITQKTINEFLVNSAEAKDIAKGIVLENGTPLYEASSLNFSKLNLVLQNNDISFVWSRNLLIDRLFYIVGISYHWDRSENPSDSTSYKLQDTGRRFSDLGSFEWDNVEVFDIGYLWDQDLGVLATSDSTNYNYLIPLEFS